LFYEKRFELGMSVAVLAAGLWAWSFRFDLMRYAVINLRRRAYEPSFFERNWDKILLALVFAFVGALVKTLVERLF
jgi:hypothetical protein